MSESARFDAKRGQRLHCEVLCFLFRRFCLHSGCERSSDTATVRTSGTFGGRASVDLDKRDHLQLSSLRLLGRFSKVLCPHGSFLVQDVAGQDFKFIALILTVSHFETARD